MERRGGCEWVGGFGDVGVEVRLEGRVGVQNGIIVVFESMWGDW